MRLSELPPAPAIRARRLPFHYGWLIVVAGVLTMLACLGIGRFALGMLLPSMGTDLQLSYAQMGLVGTGNFVGYLLAVLACGRLAGRFGARRLILAALLLVGTSMLGVAACDTFLPVLLLYTLTGFGSGASNVPLMGLISHWFGRRVRGRAAGIVQSGTGLGIMGSGLLVPALGVAWGASAWRGGWLVLGLVVIVVALAAFAILRNSPAELGLQPLGSDATDASHAALPAGPLGDHRRLLLHLGAIYFLFGFTYVIYATFIVTTLVEERGFDAVLAGRFWFWVGFLSLFSGPLFGWLSDRAGRRTALVAVFALHTAAYLSVGLGLSDPFLYLSIGLFGLAAWSVPAILAVTVGDHVGPRLAVAAFGAITFVFGLGQIAGPALAGILAEMHGGFASSYLLASGLAFTALLLAARLRPPATPAAADG